MKNRIPFIVITGFFLGGVTVFFSACENFMVDAASFKDQLKQEVMVAGAEEVEITIQARSGTGTTSPNGLSTVKLGVAFNLFLQEHEDYGFIRWATYRISDPATEVNGLVSFADPASASTKATLLSSSQDILIQPVCERRPYVWGKEPGVLFTEVVRNYPITIQFNKDIDPASVSFDNIDILGKLNGSYTDPVSVEGNFAAPSVSGRYVTISVNTALEAGWIIDVTLDGTIADMNGLAMNKVVNWQYRVNSSTDTNSPIINSVTAGTGQTAGSVSPFPAPIDTHRTGSSTENLYLAVSASDDSGVQNLFITETQIYNNTGIATNVVYPQTILAYSSANSFEYTLKCPNDGVIRLDIYVTDVNGNTSTVSTYTIIQDTTEPVGPANAAKVAASGSVGGYYNNQINFNTSSSLLDVGVATPVRTRSNLVEWAFSFDEADGTENWTAFSDWADSAGGGSITIPPSVHDGPVNIRVKFRDDQGNESTVESLPQIIMDGTKPVMDSAEILGIQSNGVTDYVNSSNISIQIGGTDNPGSGVAFYLVDDDNSINPAAGDARWTTVGTSAGSVDFTGSFTATETASHLYVWLKDMAGNVSNHFDAGEVTVDNAGPRSLTVTPVNVGNTIISAGSTFISKQDSINFIPSAIDDGIGVILGYSDNGQNSTVEILEGSPFTLAAGLNKTLYAVDKLGNPSSEANKLTVSVIKDVNGPTLSSRTVSGENDYHVALLGSTKYYHDAVLIFTATDNGGSGVKEYALSTLSDPASLTPGQWHDYMGPDVRESLPEITGSAKTLYLHLKDNLDNISTTDIESGITWFSDITGPSKPILDADNSGFDYYKSSNSTYYFNEDSGVVNVAFNSDDGTDNSGLEGFALTSSGTPSATLTLSEGTYNNIYAVDKVGNFSSSPVDSFIINSDLVHPGTPTIAETVIPNVFYDTGVNSGKIYYKDNAITEATVEFSASETGGSDLRGFNNSTALPAIENTSLTLALGTHSIYAFDNAKNYSVTPLVLQLIKDVTGPAGFVAINTTGAYYDSGTRKYYTTDNSNPLVYFSATDAGSGIKGYSKNNDGTAVNATSLNLTITTDDQTVYALDNLNNATALVIDEVIKDTAGPVISKGILNGDNTTITGLVTVDPAGGAGMDFSDSTLFTSDHGTFNGSTITGLIPGISQTITVTAKDRLGNVSASYTLSRAAVISGFGYIYNITGP